MQEAEADREQAEKPALSAQRLQDSQQRYQEAENINRARTGEEQKGP